MLVPRNHLWWRARFVRSSLYHIPDCACGWGHRVQQTCVCAQLCPTLWDPMDYSPPSSFVHVILQARILEWVAISFSRRSSQPPGIEPGSPALQADSLPTELWEKPICTTWEAPNCPKVHLSCPQWAASGLVPRAPLWEVLLWIIPTQCFSRFLAGVNQYIVKASPNICTTWIVCYLHKQKLNKQVLELTAGHREPEHCHSISVPVLCLQSNEGQMLRPSWLQTSKGGIDRT